MSTIKPFRAVRYNLDKVKDFSKVVTPPYDVINEEDQNTLLNLSPYNFTHIDFNKEKAGDKEDKYTRAQKTYEDWLKKEVLIQDDLPSIYFYKQDYKVMGQKYSRLGFISLMSLEEEGDSRVRPHEKTHAHAVEDRLKLTKALSSNLSPIFVCYSDKYRKVEKIFNKHVYGEKPDLDVEDKNKIRHKLWRLSDPLLINEINDSLIDQQLFIADGHHRYQVACEYRKQRMAAARKGTSDGQEPYNFVMTYFTNIDSKDLQILPLHRVVKSLSKSLDFLEDNFRIDKVVSRDDLPILLAKAGRNEHAFGVYTKDGVKLLRLKNKLLIDKMIKDGSPEYKSLDASILKNFVLDKMNIDSTEITYSKDFREAYEMVDNGSAQAAFILNPVKISQLKAIALNGERMPPKTTYFHPKVLSGLTVYRME